VNVSSIYDDPAVEEQWCDERRQQVIGYLAKQGLKHGEVGEWPAWHIPPYVSVWAIESLVSPGCLGWWVICGDLPTDYISASDIYHPREAMRAIAERWQEISGYMNRGEPHPTMAIGPRESWPTVAPLLSSRSQILLDWADDGELWEGLED